MKQTEQRQLIFNCMSVHQVVGSPLCLLFALLPVLKSSTKPRRIDGKARAKLMGQASAGAENPMHSCPKGDMPGRG